MGAAKKLDNLHSPIAETQITVLLVDDHFVTADLEKAFLTGLGYRVLVASTEKDLMKNLSSEAIDLLIMDMSFSKNQGLALLKSVKRQSLNRQIKVIATSVVGTNAHKKAASDSGADMFMLKPAPRSKILQEIKSLVSQKARTTERIKKHLKVSIFVNRKNKLSGETLDISSEGLHIRPAAEGTKPTLGSEVELTLHFDDSSGQPQNKKPFIVSGVVKRHTKEGFGVKFDELTTTQQRQLDKYLLGFSLEGRVSKYYL